MAETTADVKRDIEMTRERISTTLAQLEQKTNVAQIVRDHPWPAIAAAVGVGVLLSGSRADVKAASATVAATKGASSKLGGVLDEALANLMGGVHHAFQGHVDGIVEDLRKALGAPHSGVSGQRTDRVASLMAGASGASGGGARDSSPVGGADGSRGSASFAGSGASGSTTTPTSGAMGAASIGTSTPGSPPAAAGWAPQTPDAVSASAVVSANSVTGGQGRQSSVRAD